jgi:hypothetical protein
MATNSTISNDESDSTITIINDDYPLVIKEFFLNLCVNIETNRWTSKCRLCSTSITDTHKTTSNFIKHLKNKHQTIFNIWKNNQHKRIKDTNQPQINNVFSPDREKCKFTYFKNVLVTFRRIIVLY